MSALINIDNLNVSFKMKNKFFGAKDRLSAVDNVSLTINKGESFGLVGESGCGKTTLANAILGFVKADSGKIEYGGRKITDLKGEERKKMLRQMQLIFQDPYSSLNPRMPVWRLIGEPFIISGEKDMTKVKAEANRLLSMVGLSERDADRLPTDFSGGQRQRIVIARSLALSPEFIICDEPLSALDVSVHAQICNLLLDLQRDLGLTYLFISHNLAVVKHMTTRMAVMYLGQVVEMGSTEKIFSNPTHPYTRALLSAILDLSMDKTGERIILSGDAPNPINAPSTCRFVSRCPFKDGKCHLHAHLFKLDDDHFVACDKKY